MPPQQRVPPEVVIAISTLIKPYGVNVEEWLGSERSRDQKKNKRYFSVTEAMEYSGIGRCSLSRASKAGKIRTCKLSQAKSGKVLIDKDSLDSWLNSCSR